MWALSVLITERMLNRSESRDSRLLFAVASRFLFGMLLNMEPRGIPKFEATKVAVFERRDVVSDESRRQPDRSGVRGVLLCGWQEVGLN